MHYDDERENDLNKPLLIMGDCLECMKEIESGSIDMILTDPPYGTTACKWDSIIPLEPMWEQLKRIIKPNGAIVITASQPFTSILISSNIKMFKHSWIWDKVSVSNPQLAKMQPLKNYEDVIVFGKNRVNYYPQGLIEIEKKKKPKGSGGAGSDNGNELLGHIKRRKDYVQTHTNYPRMVLKYPRPSKAVHPTQKSVALMEYLVKTYTNEGETVLDFTMGSGSTGIACKNLNRSFIGIELDDKYFNIAAERINNA